MNVFNPVLLHGKIMVPGNPSVIYSGGLSIIALYKIKLCCSASGAYIELPMPIVFQQEIIEDYREY